MADARQRADWSRTLSLVVAAYAAMATGDQRPAPLDLIPEEYRPGSGEPRPVERTPEELASDSRAAWGNTFRGLGIKVPAKYR
jgi:hypothetical protein